MKPLTLGLLPTEKILPLLMAADTGRFGQADLDVQMQMLPGARARDLAIAAHAMDGYLVNTVSLVLLHLAGRDLVMVRTLLRGDARHAMFRLLAAPGRGDAVRAGDVVAISRDTVVDFVTHGLLAKLGVAPEAVKLLDLPDIPVRTAALLAGEVPFATLPEPEASHAVAHGAAVVADDRAVPPPPPGLVFHRDVATLRRLDITRLNEVIDAAAAEINADPERARSLLVRHGLVPTRDANRYLMPRFPIGDTLRAEDFASVSAWLDRTRPGALTATPEELAARLGWRP